MTGRTWGRARRNGARPRPFDARARLLGLVVAAALAASAVVGPGVAAAAPDPSSTTRGGNTSTTSSSTTTTTRRAPMPTTTTPPVAPATTPATVPPEQAIPTAGPPELEERGIRLPGDSLLAAITELGFVRVRLDALVAKQAAVGTQIADGETKLERLQARHARESAARLDRAVATYQGHASGWQFAVLTNGALSDERAVYLVDVADASARARLQRLDRSIDRTTKALAVLRAAKADVDGELPGVQHRVQLLTEKIADSAGALGVVLPPGVVAAANSKIAILADAALLALNTALVGGRSLGAERPWLDTRHALAVALAEAGGDGQKDVPARIEAEWDGTSPAVLRVVLFALRQVGKPYVYATAGPDTFDCSGLTKRAYAEIGLGMPHFSGAQLALGIPVPPTALRPGDLLSYGPDGAEHVTMYVGAGVDVEARGRAYGVVVTGVRLDPAKGFAGAVRFVP
jgi:cell wall-associated NlpC family hydrolase